MTWTWSYQTASGEAVPGEQSSQGFPTQSDAETWIGETWQELLEAGVDSVLLRDDDHVVYGPMSLHTAE
jgi:hypothetical protein